MTEIYDGNGNELTCGLQSSSVCDEAIIAARNIARDRGEPVYLEDGEDRTTVHPDGRSEAGWGLWQD